MMKQKLKVKPFLDAVLKEPEEAIEKLNLVYLDSKQLAISRERKDKDFKYLYLGEEVSEKEEIKRINSLVIPPAWERVKIAHLPNGHLQAVGYDIKKRKQYRYHPTWTRIRNQTKFYKMQAFGRQLPKIRAATEADLAQEGWPKSKVMALIIRLMEETHIRIGNQQYAKRNSTYGLSTLRSRHLKKFKDKIKFEFVGKRGKEHSITLKNRKLIRLVNRCEELPGWELFKFYDSEGNKQHVESGMVNEYIHNISGELFTAKDFRTWAASVVFFENLREKKIPISESQTQKNILSAFDEAARALGNTRNVCRKYYVHPLIVRTYEENSLEEFFQRSLEISEQPFLSSVEQVILELLNTYTPKFVNEFAKI
jgi:DNA topoisomerase-1